MKLLNVVASLNDVPASHLAKGQVGTIVDELSGHFVLVEFADIDGEAYTLERIPVGKLIELSHTRAMATWRLAAIGRSTPDVQACLSWEHDRRLRAIKRRCDPKKLDGANGR